MLIVDSLCKSFGRKTAVKSLDLEVAPGQVLGLLGPNGAGKSTSMKMVTGCLRPDAGTITLHGIDIWRQPKAAKKHLGYLPERAPLYNEYSCQEYLNYLAALRGLTGRVGKAAVDRVLDACQLGPVRYQLANTLSKGYRHRLCLAQSLLDDPTVLIFDEPTDGLDPNQKQEVRDLINRLSPGRAIVISTHLLEEVESVCTDVVVMNHGEKIYEGDPEELRGRSGPKGTLAQSFRELTLAQSTRL